MMKNTITKALALAAALCGFALAAQADVAYIDVMFALDKKAVTYLNDEKEGTTPAQYMSARLAEMNQVLVNSGLDDKFQFRSAGVYELGFEAKQIDSSKELTRDVLENATGGKGMWEDLHTERDNRGADVVSVIIDTGSEYGHVGDGNALTSIADASTFGKNAYSVVGVRSTFDYYAILHEIAHNMGAGHASEVGAGSHVTDYAYGYYFAGNTKSYYTIMGYPKTGYSPAPIFSTPDETYDGVAAGTSTKDNVRVLEQTFLAASQWRSLPAKAHPAMSVAWNQSSPMNDFAAVAQKDGSWQKAPCGCPATAAAQMLKHYVWPMRTDSSFTGATQRYIDNTAEAFPIRFDGHNDFQWAKMQDHASDNDVVGNFETARLTMWCGAMGGTDYRVGDSSAQFDDIAESASELFQKGKSTYFFSDGAEAVWKAITNALDRGELVQVTLKGHQVVADDYRLTSGDLEVHLNYGWAGSQTGWYTRTQLSDEYSGILYVWTGFAPKKMAQLKPVARQVTSTGTIPLSWALPQMYANDLTGFMIMAYYPGDSVVNSYAGDTGTIAADRAGTYTLTGVYKLTNESSLSCTLSSYHTSGIKAELQARYDAGEWTTIATPELSTEEDEYDKGVLVKSGWLATPIAVDLSSHAGETAEFRFKISRTAKTRTKDGQIFFSKPTWAKVYQPVSQQLGLQGYPTLRSYPLSASGYAGKVVSFTIEPIMSDSVVGEPVATKVVTTAVPDQPAIVSIDSLSSSMTNGFQRTCGIGKSVFFVKANATTTAVTAAPSHLTLVPDNKVSCTSVGDHTWAVTIDAEQDKVPVESQMILTLIAQDALGNKSYKDLQLTFRSGEGGAESEDTLAEKIAAGNFLYVPTEASETLPLDDTRFVAGKGTVVFDGGMPTTGVDRGFGTGYQDSWKGLVKFINFTPTQEEITRINYEFKNENSKVQIGGDPEPVPTPTVSLGFDNGKSASTILGGDTPTSMEDWDSSGVTYTKVRGSDSNYAMTISASNPKARPAAPVPSGMSDNASWSVHGVLKLAAVNNGVLFGLCGTSWQAGRYGIGVERKSANTLQVVYWYKKSGSSTAASSYQRTIIIDDIPVPNSEACYHSYLLTFNKDAAGTAASPFYTLYFDGVAVGNSGTTQKCTGCFANEKRWCVGTYYGGADQVGASIFSGAQIDDFAIWKDTCLSAAQAQSLASKFPTWPTIESYAATASGTCNWTGLSWNPSWPSGGSADAIANITVGSGGAALTINANETMSKMNVTSTAGNDLTLAIGSGVTATVAAYDFSNAAGKTTVNYTTAATPVTAGADTVLTSANNPTLTIASGKKLTVKGGTVQETTTSNGGTLGFDGGTSSSPIVYNANGNNNGNLGTWSLAQDAYVKVTPNNNKTFNINGDGAASSTVEIYKTSGQGLSTGSQFRNLKLIANITGSNQLWLEQANCVDATVALVAQGQVKLNNCDSTVGSLSGSGTIYGHQSGRVLTIAPATDATYSGDVGDNNVTITIDSGSATQTLSGYTKALTVNAGGKVALSGSANPSSITSSGLVTVPAGQLTHDVTLNSGATLNVTTNTPGEASYSITSGTFDNKGTVQLNGVNLPNADYEVSGNQIVKKGAPTPTGAIHATVASGTTTDWGAIQWYNASEQKIGTISDFSQVTSAALTIANAGVVTIDNATFSDLGTKLTITGAGTLVYDVTHVTTFPTTAPTGLTAAGWTGVVCFTGYTFNGGQALTNFGNVGSKVRMVKCAGYLPQAAGGFAFTLDLANGDGDYGFNVNNGWSQGIAFGGLTGDGTFKMSKPAGQPTLQYIFTNATQFAGSIDVNTSNTRMSVVLGAAAYDSAVANYGKILVKGVANVASGKTWTAVGGIQIDGKIGGSGTLASNATFGDGAEIDNCNGTLNATGDLTFGATTKVRVATAPAGDVKVINKSGTTAGEILTTVSVYVGESETPETGNYKLAYKTDGVYLVAGESPYAKFDYGIVYSWLTTGSSVVCMSSGDSSYQVFDIVGGTNKTDTTYHGNTTFKDQPFWKQFAYATGISTTYAAPGDILRLAQGSYLTSIGATWGPLTIGGIIAEAGDTAYTFVNKSDGTRSNLLGDPSNTTPTFFDIGANVTFDRTGKLYLSGTLTFDIASGKTFNLNSAKTGQELALFATVEAAGSGAFGTTTAGGTLIMKGEGTLQVYNLKALGSTLDYRNLPYDRANAYISGTLTINDSTVIKLPADLPENTAFKMATTLSGATSGDRTIWLGDEQVTKNVTFANGTISYSTTLVYKYLGWNGSAWTNGVGEVTAVDSTCILNAKDGDVITFASAVTPHQFNMPESGTVTLNDQQNLSVGTVEIPSAATLVIKANNTFSPALTGSGILSVNPGQVQFSGPTKLPALSGFSGKLQMVSGRLQDYTSTSLLPTAVTLEILDGAQLFVGSALTLSNTCIFRGNGWTGESNIWRYGPARFSDNVTLSGSVTFDRDNAAPQILIASGKTLTLSGAVSAPHGFTTAGSDGTIKLTTVADDTIAGAVTLNTGDIWYGTGKDSGGTAGTSYKCGDTIIVKTGRTFNLHPWTTTQKDDSESNKVILASAIDMLGGTFHVEDGSYVFSGDFNVSSNSTLSFKWAKGRVIKSLTGGSDVTLTVNSANSDTSVSKNYFKGGDFAGTLKLTGSGTGAYCVPYDTALSKTTVSLESGWDICLTQNATIGSLNGGQSVFGDGTASPTLTLKGGIYSGTLKDTSSGAAVGTPLSLSIDGEVALSGGTTYSGATTVNPNGVLALTATAQQTLSSLVFEESSTLIVNTNATQAAVAVSSAVNFANATLKLGNTLPAAGGTIKLLSATGGITNPPKTLDSRGEWTLTVTDNTLTATKAKANYVKPGAGGNVSDVVNDADSLDISRDLAKKATKDMEKKVTDGSTTEQVVEALNQTGKNTYKVWESAVLGLDPNDATSQLVISPTPVQGNDPTKIILKVPAVNVDTTTGADVTFCFWSKTGDGDWTEVQGGVVESDEEKALALPSEGVMYYQLRTTIKAGQVTPIPTVIPSANIVASGAPILTTPGAQYAASMGTTTLDVMSSSLTVALAGAGVYEGQEYHLEVTEPANADENHFAIVAKATANKTVSFVFGKNVPAGTTCTLTLLSASGAPNGNVKVASSGFTGPTYAEVMVMARLADLPMNDGFGGQSGHNGYRIPALATDGAGEVIACYDVRQFGSADWSDLGVPAGAGIDIGESYSDSRGVNFDKPRLGIDVENYYHADGTKESTWTKDKDIGDVSIVWDPSRSQYWLMGITGKGLTNCDGTNLNDVVLYTRAKGRGTAWTEWHNPDLAGETEKLKYRSIQHTVLKQTGLASCGRGFLEGPGHGMVTKIGSKDGTTIPIGTVVFPVQYFLSSDTSNIHAGAIYLKPGEITTANNWVATGRTPGSSGPQENCVMELDDGSWYMMCKYSTNYKAWRTTNYQDWVDVNDGLTGVAHVQGSCLRIGVDANNVGQYVFCHANDTSRQKLTLFFGVDTTKGETGTIPSTTNKGIQWDLQNGIMIDIGPCGGMTYNSMCMLDDHTLGILYETQWHIQFVRIDVSDKVVSPAK